MPNPEIPQKASYKVVLKPNTTYWWCACGKSQNQPFCDGSHKGSEFSPQSFEVKEEKIYSVCGCKHSALGWLCDGAHKQL